jgi:auxin response factor
LEPLDTADPQPPQPPLRNKRARPPASPSVVTELSPKFGKIYELLSTSYK